MVDDLLIYKEILKTSFFFFLTSLNCSEFAHFIAYLLVLYEMLGVCVYVCVCVLLDKDSTQFPSYGYIKGKTITYIIAWGSAILSS